uniref:C-X3-C motif chemokine ligand 1 n=1 Tax=Molossus molossus TaxID=27622 RepID=A0A7J8C6T3_MOLMO|nr:C-X3-C motif chemokine ligand 1 [Molossus molossus]
MAAHPLSWLLRVAALCHLTALLAGQHHGVNKCSIICNQMTSEISVKVLMSYQRNQASCRKPAIILKTIKNRTFCADPEAKWVQEAMEYLDRKAMPRGSTFEKQIGATTARTTWGTDSAAVPELSAAGESSSWEAPGALGTSLELPTEVTGSWGTRSPTASKTPNGGPSAGPEETELFSTAAATTATSWQSSAHQLGLDLPAEGKASEAPSTPPPSTQTTSTQAPSTQTLPTQNLSTQAPSTPPPSTQAPSTQTPSTQTTSTQAPSTQAPSTQTPSTHQILPTQAPSTQAPISLHTAPEGSIGPEGQPVWTHRQDPMLDNPLGFREQGPISAHTDAFMGPGSMPQVSVVPVSSEGAPSREPVASGSWAPKAEDPQRLDTLITPIPDSQVATRRQAVGLLAFLGLLFCLGVAMFAYQSLQGCPRNMAGEMVEGLRYVPRSCGSNSYVLVPV